MKRSALIVAMTLAAACPLAAQETPDEDPPSPREFTVTAGVGHAVGWLGGQAEWYFSGDRMSVFAGLGHTIRWEIGDPGGLTAAGGLRGFTAGTNHRGYLELSVSQIDTGFSEVMYGPGLQAGYQFVTDGGFTGTASFGVGYGLGANPTTRRSQGPVQPMFGLTVGYTWR